jgi:hypothetical protein
LQGALQSDDFEPVGIIGSPRANAPKHSSQTGFFNGTRSVASRIVGRRGLGQEEQIEHSSISKFLHAGPLNLGWHRH